MGIGSIPLKDKDGYPIGRGSNVAMDEKHRVRHKGIFNIAVASGVSSDTDWQVEQLQYNEQNVPSIMTGIRYRVYEGNGDDSIDFSVGDKDGVMVGILYDQATFDALKAAGNGFVSLDQFSDNFYLFSDESSEIREHKVDLITGLYIRAHIVNSGTNAKSLKFLGNILRYIDTTGV